MHWRGRKFKLFSTRSGFKGQIFTGEVSGVDSAGALRQGVSMNSSPPRCGKGAYVTKRFHPSASTSRARRSDAATFGKD